MKVGPVFVWVNFLKGRTREVFMVSVNYAKIVLYNKTNNWSGMT